MPRIRSIKPEFFTSETIATLSVSARLTFIGLWTYVDDDGVGLDNERLIMAAVYPLDDDLVATLTRLREDLRSLSGAGLVTRYQVGQKRYLHVTSWVEHQKVSHPRASRYPQPDDPTVTSTDTPSGGSPEPSGDFPEPLRPEQGAGSREQGEEPAAPPAAQNPPAEPDAPPPADAAKAAATDAYEAIGKAGKFMALHGHAKWALRERGLTHDQFVHVVREVYTAGRPVTRESLGQAIDGHQRRTRDRPGAGAYATALASMTHQPPAIGA